MSDIGFLQRFPALRTRDPDEVRHWLKPIFAVRRFDMPHGQRELDTILNHRRSGGIGLTYARYGASLSANLQQNDYFVQGFPISGAGEILWNRKELSVSTRSGGVVGGPGSEATFSYDSNFSHLIATFSPAALARKLSTMIGRPIDPPLRLEGNPAHLVGQYQLIQFLAGELDRIDGQLPAVALAEIEQAIIVAYLSAHTHNYSHRLNGEPLMIAPWQVRQAAEYIEQNWDQPITIEDLSNITQTSARSLFHLFKRTYGVSPMVFARRIRLRHARAMLSRPDMKTSVTSVGFLCGFSNLGHFARAYHGAFGELPSETLKAHR